MRKYVLYFGCLGASKILPRRQRRRPIEGDPRLGVFGIAATEIINTNSDIKGRVIQMRRLRCLLFSVAQASRLCRRKPKPAATKFSLVNIWFSSILSV